MRGGFAGGVSLEEARARRGASQTHARDERTQGILNRPYLSAVFLGGSIAGALDIIFAISFAAYNGIAPVRLLQIVASGLLGTEAFTGGVRVAVLGLALHFALSFLWASIFLSLA